MTHPPLSWKSFLEPEINSEYWESMARFVASKSETATVFPETKNIYKALEYTNPDEVRVVLLGQDPYHGEGQAHGLSFSVPPGIQLPPSLRNIFKELMGDVNIITPLFGDLTPWTKQGVLLLNSVFTVEKGKPGSHFNKGWERCSDTILKKLSETSSPKAFVLWGNKAGEKAQFLDSNKHLIIQQVHPSPLSAYRGFMGSKPFSTINTFFEQKGLPPVNWALNE
jgi:uracil-DNA glycosylase